ncbi:hypothetical protein, partial [Faecalibacterium prausnitzii]|uniref:hypothetical protein n=1 Tax=Faecalibacterium prausnitzii TaxID=853 RepID=UPI001A9C0A59
FWFLFHLAPKKNPTPPLGVFSRHLFVFFFFFFLKKPPPPPKKKKKKINPPEHFTIDNAKKALYN